MNPAYQLQLVIQSLIAAINHLAGVQARQAAVYVTPSSSGIFNASIMSDLITAVTVIICVAVVAGTVITITVMTQMHRRMREVAGPGNKDLPS